MINCVKKCFLIGLMQGHLSKWMFNCLCMYLISDWFHKPDFFCFFDEQRDDFLSIHESIKKLRSYFGSDNPGCETIDQLEDEIVTLINRLCLREPFANKSQVNTILRT